MATEQASAGLERELEGMLEIERFDPPEEFRKQALWSDPKIYEEADADPVAFWHRQATELLDWHTLPATSGSRTAA
jgi:acetyl-CoA synthetase